MLLSQEQIQIVHYSAILDTFDEAAFSAAGLPGSARGAIEAILAAEEAHIAALARPDDGSIPAPAAPELTDLTEALREAAELENLAVASYAFVIPELDRQRLLPTLIGIHSVEARHAAWLATLLETNPFPEAIDPALTLSSRRLDSGEPTVVPPAGTPDIPSRNGLADRGDRRGPRRTPADGPGGHHRTPRLARQLAWLPATRHALRPGGHTGLSGPGRGFR